MKRIIIYCLAFFILSGFQVYGQETNAYLKKLFISEGDTLPYRILYPKDYDKNKSYPLVLFLHGSGERGRDNELQLVHGSSLFLEEDHQNDYPAFVVFPQCPKEGYWSDIEQVGGYRHFPFRVNPRPSMKLLLGLLDQLEEGLNIDATRRYVGGLSMGGFGTFELLARRPDYFAAAFPICGGGNPLLAGLYADNTALWVFHGAKDDIVSPKNSRSVVDALEELMADVRYTEYPEANHNSWDPAFAEPELLPWLFSNKLYLPKDRYLKQVFTEVDSRTITYHRNESEFLQLDFYQPVDDKLRARPLILYVHGGGFAGGRRDELRYRQFAQRMARRGFALASISYRLTMKGKSFSCDQAAKNKIQTFKYATEDIWRATNFILSRSEQLGIDQDKIILAGSSAGAEAVLHAAYWTAKDLIDLPEQPALPEDFKYGGVISMAGALVDTLLISKENAIPTLLFHGTCDNLVPFGTAPHHYCEEAEKGYLMLHGANSIAKRLHHLNGSYWFVAQCGGAHEWNDRPLFDFVQPMSEAILEMVMKGGKWQRTEVVEKQRDCKLEAAAGCEEVWKGNQ
jgi:predicted peptidase